MCSMQERKKFNVLIQVQSVQFSHSVMFNYMRPMGCSMPGLPVHHHLPEITQIHVHWVSDAIQASHPLSSTSPSAFNLSQHQGLFQCVSFCLRWPMCWSFSINPSNEYSELISFRIDWFDLLAVQGSPAQQIKSINSSVLRLLYGLTLTCVHDYWKNHSFDWMGLCRQSDVSAFVF